MKQTPWTISDRIVSYFSPEAGIRRYQARMVAEELKGLSARHYEGASVGRRTSGWLTPGSSANTAAALALPYLRNRARDLVRNNSYANRAINVLTRNVVGPGIYGAPNSSAKGRNGKVADRWKDWGTHCDLTGQSNFAGLQRLAARSVFEGGEMLVRRVRSADKSLAVPFQLQLLEADFLDHNRTMLRTKPSDNFIIQGIEFDPNMRVVAYWIFPEHPGGYVTGQLMGVQSERVPASEVVHLYPIDRIGQIHGIPRLAPALIRLRDFDEYEDAQLVRQKIAACFSAFIHDTDAPIDAPSKAKGAAKIERIEPGIIEYLPPGKNITFGSPPTTEGTADYASTVLRGISVGTDVTYEQLTGDYSKVNFSSARMARLEFNRAMAEYQWQMMVPRFLEPIWRWFIEGATMKGDSASGMPAKWCPPPPDMIDVDKETRANSAAIRSGQKTWSQVVRENGDDPDEMLQEMAEDFEKFDKYGLTLDCDPRKMTQQGNAQVTPTSEGKDSPENQEDK